VAVCGECARVWGAEGVRWRCLWCFGGRVSVALQCLCARPPSFVRATTAHARSFPLIALPPAVLVMECSLRALRVFPLASKPSGVDSSILVTRVMACHLPATWQARCLLAAGPGQRAACVCCAPVRMHPAAGRRAGATAGAWR
jgi:hypothetical protein